MKIKTLICLMLLCGFCNASNSTMQVTDINTRLPIPSADVLTYFSNHTSNETHITDTLGLTTFPRLDGYAIISKNGYFTLNKSMTALDDVIYSVMTPISSDGIVRFKIKDLSMGYRDFCIFYKENMRLDACYKSNDTVSLLVNREFIIYPELRKEDAILGIKSMDKIGGFYIGSLMPLLVLFMVGLIVLIYIMRAIRRR